MLRANFPSLLKGGKVMKYGKSKMVNKKGEPEVWYHGTAGAFQAFDKPELSKDVPGKKRGIFFTKDPKFAGDFARMKGMKKRFHFRDGSINEGEILNVEGDLVELKTGSGTFKIPRNEFLAETAEITNKTGEKFVSTIGAVTL